MNRLTLLRPRSAPLNITWHVLRDTEAYRVIYVVAEGVSMAVPLRSECRSYILQYGGRIAALITAPSERIAADAATRDPDRQASRR